MKQFFYLLPMMIFASFFSCEKQSVTTVEDNIPEIEVKEIIALDTSKTPPITEIYSGEIALTTFIFDSVTMEVNNYSLVMPSSYIGAPEAVFAGAWAPSSPETELQSTTYIIDHVSILSSEGVDVISSWQDSGSDPDTAPDFEAYFTYYDMSEVICVVSNITASTADVEISGNIINSTGTTIPVSGSLIADLYD